MEGRIGKVWGSEAGESRTLKPPEVAAVEEPSPKAKSRSGPPGKTVLSSGDSNFAIEEQIGSLAEQLGHYRSGVERVCNTVELSDYFGKKSSADVRPCYSLESALNLEDKEVAKQSVQGLGTLLDKLLLANPSFATVTQVSDLAAENF